MMINFKSNFFLCLTQHFFYSLVHLPVTLTEQGFENALSSIYNVGNSPRSLDSSVAKITSRIILNIFNSERVLIDVKNAITILQKLVNEGANTIK